MKGRKVKRKPVTKAILTICIPTIYGREDNYSNMVENINEQISNSKNTGKVLIIKEVDNKELSIGLKRQKLLDNVTTPYCVQIDDDDDIAPDYISEVMKALSSEPDCVGYLESVNMDGAERTCIHSNRFDNWYTSHQGYDYVRCIFNKDVIKTSIAKTIGFTDLRYAEDYDFSFRLKQSQLLEREVFIDKIMYYYNTKIYTPKEQNERYGI